MGAAGAEVVAVPRPDLPARTAFVRFLRDTYGAIEWRMTPEGLGAVRARHPVSRSRSA